MFIFGYLIKKLLEDIFHQNLYYYINKKGSKETLGFALTLLLKCVFTMMIMGLFCDPFHSSPSKPIITQRIFRGTTINIY